MGNEVRHRLRRELLAQGLTPTEIRTAVRRGELCVIDRGAYVDTSRYYDLRAAEQHRIRALAAGERSPERIVSHVSAAALHRLPLYDLDLSRVHLTRQGHGGNRRSADRWIHAGVLDEAFLVRVDGVLSTSVARTLLDLGKTASVDATVVAADAAAHRELATAEQVTYALCVAGRHAGRPRAERVLALVDGRSESPGETLLRLQLCALPLPAPQLQVKVFDEDGEFVGRTDGGYLEHGVLLEFDGEAKYGELLRPGQTATEAILAEKRREERLTALGWHVLRFTWDDLRRPRTLARRVLRACAAHRAWVGAIRGSTQVCPPLRLV